MRAGYDHLKFAQRLAAIIHGEAADGPSSGILAMLEARGLRVADTEVGALARAIRNRAAPDARQKIAHTLIVVTDHGHAVKRQPVKKIDEGLLDVVHVTIRVHMLAVDVGHHSDDGRKFQK